MRSLRGVVYVAYGRRAIDAAKISIASLKRTNSFPIVVISDKIGLEIQGTDVVRLTTTGTNVQRSRHAKLHLLDWVPAEWRSILYLDADTEVLGKLMPGFKNLESGWDLAIVPSTYQGRDLLYHVGGLEKGQTLVELQNPEPLQLQAGVMFIRRNDASTALFRTWQMEWMRFRGQDQAALLRALDKTPVRILLLGRDYNGGDLVLHHFRRAV